MSDTALHHSLILLRGALQAVIGCNFGEVGPREHQSITAIGSKNEDALQIRSESIPQNKIDHCEIQCLPLVEAALCSEP
jgi:hypothetical protein